MRCASARWCSREGLFHRLRDGDAVQPGRVRWRGRYRRRWRLLFLPLGAPACSPGWLGIPRSVPLVVAGYRPGTAPGQDGDGGVLVVTLYAAPDSSRLHSSVVGYVR